MLTLELQATQLSALAPLLLLPLPWAPEIEEGPAWPLLPAAGGAPRCTVPGCLSKQRSSGKAVASPPESLAGHSMTRLSGILP